MTAYMPACLSVRLFAWSQMARTGRIFLKLIEDISNTCQENSNVIKIRHL